MSQTGTVYEKALPRPTPTTAPFWESCKRHELRMQFCTRSSEWIWYPKAWCPGCGSRDHIEWRKLSGEGEVYSFTVIRQVIDNSSAFQKDIPFAIGLVETMESPRLFSNIVGSLDKISIGRGVSVFFDDLTAEFSLPKFRLAD